MKTYPSINNSRKNFGKHCIAFDKLDGSNLRAEWSKKRGWYKFGSRKQMIDESHEQFGHGVKLFLEKYGDVLPPIFEHNFNMFKGITFTVFFEYHGDNSFAGQHPDELEDMKVTLFDVFVKNKGQINPFDFVKYFEHTGIPQIVYEGNYNKQFMKNVMLNCLDGFDLCEGVVVKGFDGKRTWMAKVKTKGWINKVNGKGSLSNDDSKRYNDLVNYLK